MKLFYAPFRDARLPDRYHLAELDRGCCASNCAADCFSLLANVLGRGPSTHRGIRPRASFRSSRTSPFAPLRVFRRSNAPTLDRDFDVARPRGPPAQAREDLYPTRVSPNTPGAYASLLGRFPAKVRAGSGSSESRHSSVRPPIPASSNLFEPMNSSLSTTLASRRSREPIGVDAHHHGGDP